MTWLACNCAQTNANSKVCKRINRPVSLLSSAAVLTCDRMPYSAAVQYAAGCIACLTHHNFNEARSKDLACLAAAAPFNATTAAHAPGTQQHCSDHAAVLSVSLLSAGCQQARKLPQHTQQHHSSTGGCSQVRGNGCAAHSVTAVLLCRCTTVPQQQSDVAGQQQQHHSSTGGCSQVRRNGCAAHSVTAVGCCA
jgi:hypothetical protein